MHVCFLGYSFVSLDPLYSLTESDIHDRQLPEGIGARWKDLARKLGFKERSIEVIERENCFTTTVVSNFWCDGWKREVNMVPLLGNSLKL